eukprot:scaffold1790_cov257-Pinguiococcus_pyrenoidosus.AAC.26
MRIAATLASSMAMEVRPPSLRKRKRTPDNGRQITDAKRRTPLLLFPGFRASEFARQRLHQILLEELEQAMCIEGGTSAECDPTIMTKSLTNAFEACDEQFLSMAAMQALGDGSTLLVAIIEGSRLYVANAGDCRAVLVKKGGKTVALSEDHKPNLPRESKRIQESGGRVYFDGSWRVEGILAVARAMGDMMLKPYVVATPEVTEHTIAEDDLYLILASDGLWDTISNQDAARIDFRAAAYDLIERAQDAHSADNITALLPRRSSVLLGPASLVLKRGLWIVSGVVERFAWSGSRGSCARCGSLPVLFATSCPLCQEHVHVDVRILSESCGCARIVCLLSILSAGMVARICVDE